MHRAPTAFPANESFRAPQGGHGTMANQVGKRYVCKKCGAEFIVTRKGDGTIACCGQPMELKK